MHRCVPAQLILSLLREKVERKPLGVEELAAAAAAAASTAEPPAKACQSSCNSPTVLILTDSRHFVQSNNSVHSSSPPAV